MNEVTKLYENAGVKPINFAKQGAIDFTNTIEIDGKRYLDFTAEKQLELIKWLVRKGLIQINYSSHQCYQFNSFRVGGDYKTDICEALASHCNNLWQDLIEEERKQIKNILE